MLFFGIDYFVYAWGVCSVIIIVVGCVLIARMWIGFFREGEGDEECGLTTRDLKVDELKRTVGTGISDKKAQKDQTVKVSDGKSS